MNRVVWKIKTEFKAWKLILWKPRYFLSFNLVYFVVFAETTCNKSTFFKNIKILINIHKYILVHYTKVHLFTLCHLHNIYNLENFRKILSLWTFQQFLKVLPQKSRKVYKIEKTLLVNENSCSNCANSSRPRCFFRRLEEKQQKYKTNPY